MSAIILSGKELAAQLETAQAQRVRELQARGVSPKLAVVMAGDNPASAIYVRNKARACERLGILSDTIQMPQTVSQQELLRVDPAKDVDGFHLYNAGRLLRGEDGMRPCTPQGIVRLLKSAGIALDGARAVVIGRSNIVGKPAALMLTQENCTVTLCHSHTRDLAQITRQADILVAAVGKPRFVTADMVKPGAAVIDVGINRVDGKVVGDVDFDAVSAVASFITPVPGGVGPMTVSMLMENTLEAAWKASR